MESIFKFVMKIYWIYWKYIGNIGNFGNILEIYWKYWKYIFKNIIIFFFMTQFTRLNYQLHDNFVHFVTTLERLAK